MGIVIGVGTFLTIRRIFGRFVRIILSGLNRFDGWCVGVCCFGRVVRRVVVSDGRFTHPGMPRFPRFQVENTLF